MKKNIYVVPAIEVVKIQQATALLIGSVFDDPASNSLDVLSREAEFSDELLDAGELFEE